MIAEVKKGDEQLKTWWKGEQGGNAMLRKKALILTSLFRRSLGLIAVVVMLPIVLSIIIVVALYSAMFDDDEVREFKRLS
ncbi:hypothetical protein JDN40_03815 [Rhodomicrobium vannielii ATCC 17100]|uniref:hypothetical protein n=1 Tax=Rhodomicrobium vannielii TaxID=1069 RepID=UPI00191AC675|nr:hypothetical protein [Rhodomicrobium vannielii]MBJ7533232.1 hypothetical protein [Rhodomicrobium vannielii ATCC 17100]